MFKIIEASFYNFIDNIQKIKSDNLSNIYIIPTKFGFIYLLGIVIVILTGTIYGNNLLFILAFMMFAVFFVSMIQTHANLKKIKVKFKNLKDSFANEYNSIVFEIENNDKSFKYMLSTKLRGHKFDYKQTRAIQKINSKKSEPTQIYIKFPKRGKYLIPDLIIYTIYPLGLFYAWRILRTEEESVYVYPEAKQIDRLPNRNSSDQDSNEKDSLIHQYNNSSGVDEFHTHKLMLNGESLNRIDWKLFGKTGRLYVKQFSDLSQNQIFIKWSEINEKSIESKLSVISSMINLAEKSGLNYSLEIPGQKFNLNCGSDHFKLCQRSLSIFKEEII